MRAQAQGLSSAANRDGSATRGSVFGHSSAATRASSLSADGSGASSHRSTRFAIGLLAAALALLAIAPNATAVLTRARTASFGTDGTSATSFGDPNQLAANQANDKLYVLDKSGPSIHAFNTPARTPVGGAFPLSVVSTGGEPDISVDNTALPSANNIYYLSESNGLYGFDSAGSGLAGFPVTGFGDPCGSGVDSAGNIWVGDYATQSVKKYDSAGAARGSVDTSSQGNPCHVAFDSNDDMFVAMYQGAVWKYTAPAYTTATQIDSASTYAIALDTTAHTLYVSHSGKVSAYRASDSALLYEFASGIANASFRGLAVDQGTDEVYVSDTGSGTDKVHVFSAAQNYGDATARPNAATNVTDTGADISATVTDNNALPTNWRLELFADGGSTWNTVASGQTAGNEVNAVVSRSLTGLTPNADYRFRVVTNKGSGSTDVASGVSVFRTASVPPVVSDVGAVQVTDTSARLVGTIDPRNSATGYVFEFGTTPALGSSTAPVNIGGGTTPTTVSQVVGGLARDTTYYFRLVATNAFGSTPSVQRTLHTRTDPLPLPDDRAYEMVSPPDKNLGGADKAVATSLPQAAVSRDGEAVAFCTASLFGDPAAQQAGLCGAYVSRRGPGGWQTTSPLPRFCRVDPVTGVTGGVGASLSPNFDRAAVSLFESPSCDIQPLDPAAPAVARNLYRQDLTADPFDFDLLATQAVPGTAGNPANPGFFAGGSDDFSHVLYVSRANQTAPPDSPPPGDFHKLYEWANGTLRLASVRPDGNPFDTPSNIPGIWFGGSRSVLASAVSGYGERVYFQNPAPKTVEDPGCGAPACELYMREGGAVTHHASASECTLGPAICGSEQPDEFKWAAPDGEVALFTSCAKLTNASSVSVPCTGSADPPPGAKLYRWDRSAPPGNRLVDLTVDNEPFDGVQPDVKGVIGVSDDGDVVFFAATRAIVSGQPKLSGVGIYRWRWNAGSPSVDYLGSVSSDTTTNPDQHTWDLQHRRVTPDGRYLVISTVVALDPVGDRDTDRDVYRWDAQDEWTCVSCQLPGAPSGGNASDNIYSSGRTISLTHLRLQSYEPTVTGSDDGRIFFDTPDALVPGDTNGETDCPPVVYPAGVYACQDVYEWDDGAVNLISSGVGSDPAYLLGTTSSGEDVFFFTRQRLVGWDLDTGVDIYDARVGGGFPEPPPVPPPCDLDAGACEGPGTAAAAIAGAGSRVFVGQGNIRRESSNTCGRISKKAQRKLAAAKRAARKGKAKRAQGLRKQARNLNRRAKRCNRRQAS